MEPSMGIVSGIYRFITGVWEYKRKRPNIKFKIDFDKTEEISNQLTAVIDAPHIDIKVDPKKVVLTLTNIGYENAELTELRAVIQGKDVPLRHTNSFSFGTLNKRSGTISNVHVLDGGIYDYTSESELGSLASHKQFIAYLKGGLFIYKVDKIYVKDVLGNIWNIDKKLLNDFYKEYKKFNPDSK